MRMILCFGQTLRPIITQDKLKIDHTILFVPLFHEKTITLTLPRLTPHKIFVLQYINKSIFYKKKGFEVCTKTYEYVILLIHIFTAKIIRTLFSNNKFPNRIKRFIAIFVLSSTITANISLSPPLSCLVCSGYTFILFLLVCTAASFLYGILSFLVTSNNKKLSSYFVMIMFVLVN